MNQRNTLLGRWGGSNRISIVSALVVQNKQGSGKCRDALLKVYCIMVVGMFAVFAIGCGGGEKGVPCVPDCDGRECGLDPVCGEPCEPGCNEDFECEDGRCVEIGCVSDCTGRECGPDPVCGRLCEPGCNEGFECEDGQCVDMSGCNFPLTSPPSLAVSGETLFVSTSGNDDNPGTEQQPFATIQHAVDSAGPGDKVLVEPGVYYERIFIRERAGTAEDPIVIEGKPGAVINGGNELLDWQPATEVGFGVFKASHIGWEPRNMTWNGKYVREVGVSTMESSSARSEMLGLEASDPFWDRSPALFGNLDGVTYVRLRDGQNPGDENVRFAPKSGVWNRAGIRLYESDHFVIRGFTIKSGYRAVEFFDSSHNILEYNRLTSGTQIIEVVDGSAGNHIRNNEITLDYVYSEVGNGEIGADIYSEVWNDFKWSSRVRNGDPNTIRMSRAGSDNHFYNNYIHRSFEAFGLGDPGSDENESLRTMVYNNIILYIHDSGIEVTSALKDSHVFNNIVAETLNGIRVKDGFTEGPIYIYQNLIYNSKHVFYNGSESGSGFFTWDTPGLLYFYHNTISHPNRAISWAWGGGSFDDSPYRAENYWFVNNVFSSERLASFNHGLLPRARMDYNWIGGSIDDAWPEELSNVFAGGEQIWPYDEIGFALPDASTARNAGIDLSHSWSVDGVNHSALPGMMEGYFSGSAPDVGAIQFGDDLFDNLLQCIKEVFY